MKYASRKSITESFKLYLEDGVQRTAEMHTLYLQSKCEELNKNDHFIDPDSVSYIFSSSSHEILRSDDTLQDCLVRYTNQSFRQTLSQCVYAKNKIGWQFPGTFEDGVPIPTLALITAGVSNSNLVL